jgi:serine/threonine protein kinase
MSGPSSSSYIQVPDASTSSGKVKVVAGYALQQKLGSGSFAVVYKGVRLPETKTEFATVAIKAITRNSDRMTSKVLQNLEGTRTSAVWFCTPLSTTTTWNLTFVVQLKSLSSAAIDTGRLCVYTMYKRQNDIFTSFSNTAPVAMCRV